MALTLVLATVLATLGWRWPVRARASDWLLLPGFLVIANFIEWMVHRHPMHRRCARASCTATTRSCITWRSPTVTW
jgi:hypothetical protein